MSRPWEHASDPSPAPPPAPAPSLAAVVTPATGPPSQDPPKPIVLQNAMVGLGQMATTNLLTTGITQDSDIIKLSLVCNGFAQIVKQHPRFNEKAWTLPFMMVVGVIAGAYLLHDPSHVDVHRIWESISPKAVIDGIIGAVQAAMNYHGLQATGVSPLTSVPFEHSVEGRTT